MESGSARHRGSTGPARFGLTSCSDGCAYHLLESVDLEAGPELAVGDLDREIFVGEAGDEALVPFGRGPVVAEAQDDEGVPGVRVELVGDISITYLNPEASRSSNASIGERTRFSGSPSPLSLSP